MENVKVGIIGIGNMGSSHLKTIIRGEIEGAKLIAVADVKEERLEWAKKELAEDVLLFDSAEALINCKDVDAVIIATPHYDHPTLAIKAFEADKHVLIEKPAGVYTKAVRNMNEVAGGSNKIFAIMYNWRTFGLYQKVKDLVHSGELGEVRRINWIITNWYRPQSYYNSGGWRASWAGEGGGVLLNQCPHQLDIWQWVCGMPTRIRAFCHFGKMHDIEVEDDVTAYLEYENGATGVFVTATSDTPGTNRLEITGDNGKLIIEDWKIEFYRNRISERKFNEKFTGVFGNPEVWKCDIPIQKNGDPHATILKNWVNAIVKDEALIAPGSEGINGLTLSNAMYLSSWMDDWVDLPIDEDLFYEKLQEKIANSTYIKKVKKITAVDMSSSF